MRKYESTVLIKPTLEPEKAMEVSNQLLEILNSNGANATALNKLDKTEKIQYEIRGGYTQAYWQTFSFNANPEFIKEFERLMRINDNVIRFVVFKIDEQKIENANIKKQRKAQRKAQKLEEKKQEEVQVEETK